MKTKLGHLFIAVIISLSVVFSATSKAAQTPIYEAESGFLYYPAGSDKNASGGKYVEAPDGTGEFKNSPGPAIAYYEFNLNSAGKYYLLARVKSANPLDKHNSFWLQIDNDDPIKWHPINEKNGWHWEKKELGNLSAGQHAFYLNCREDETKMDQWRITTDTDSSDPRGEDVPIGAVLDWWRPNSDFPLPDGFKICDGSVISDSESPYDGATVPDLRNRFVRGASSMGTIGVPGGADTHAHANNHYHSGYTGYAGNHLHKWAEIRRDRAWYSGNGTKMIDYDNGIGNEGRGNYLVGVVNIPYTRAFFTDRVPSHRHNAGSVVSNIGTGSNSNVPRYVGLLKIMRIK